MNAFRSLLTFVLLSGLAAGAGAAERSDSTAAPAPTATASARGQVDLNTADIPTLERIPEIGTDHANAVVASRPFKSVDDVQRVLKLAPERWNTLRGKIRVSPVPPAARTASDPRASSGPSKTPVANDGKATPHQKVTDRYDRAEKAPQK